MARVWTQPANGRAGAWIVALGLTTVPAVRAQSQSPPVEIVVTGTRSVQALERSTLPTGVVSREEAERRGAVSVAEALEGEPGLQVNPNAYGYLGSPAGVMMQGLDAERVLVLRDGERIVGDSGGVIDLDQLGVTDVERVEYVLGPTSSLYGTGALGGVVNIVTGGPRAEGFSTRARLEARSLPELLAASWNGYRAGTYWLVGSTSYRRSAGLRLFDDLPDLALAEKEHVELGVRAGSDEPGMASVAEVHWSHSESAGLQSQEVPGLGRYLVELPDRTQRVRTQIRQTYDLGDSTELRVSGSGQLFMGESLKDRRDSTLDERRDREQRLFSAEALLTVYDGPRTWLTGARVEQEDFEQNLTKRELVAGEPIDRRASEVSPVGLSSSALFAQVGWRFDETFTLMPGVRAELHNRFGHVLAPRLAAAWRPAERWLVRTSIGRGFRGPSAKEYGFLFDHSFLGYRVIGNPELKPESSWGVGGDVSFSPDQRFLLRIGGFHNWVSDLISTQYVGQSSPGVDDYGYVNVDAARTAGLDASATWRLWPRLRAQVAYAHLFTQNDTTHTPLPARPAHTVLSALTVEPLDGFELTLRQRTVSDAYLSEGLDAPGFSKLDVRAALRVAQYFRVHLGVLNGLDAKDDPTRPGDQRPVAGRIYFAGITGHYEEGM